MGQACSTPQDIQWAAACPLASSRYASTCLGLVHAVTREEFVDPTDAHFQTMHVIIGTRKNRRTFLRTPTLPAVPRPSLCARHTESSNLNWTQATFILRGRARKWRVPEEPVLISLVMDPFLFMVSLIPGDSGAAFGPSSPDHSQVHLA